MRYSALHGLVRVCRGSSGDQTRDAYRACAWGALLQARAAEPDLRVLEALRVGEVRTAHRHGHVYVSKKKKQQNKNKQTKTKTKKRNKKKNNPSSTLEKKWSV